MRSRLSLLLAGSALAIGGGVAGAVVVAPSLGSDPSSVEVRQAAAKEAQATLKHTFHVAKKARGMARGARQLANSLAGQVEQALTTAESTSTRLDSTRAVSRTEAGTVSTSEESDYVSLGGPSVTVDVQSSGLIEVWATVRFEDPADGVVALYEDGQRVGVPGQEGFCTGGGLDDVLMSASFGSGSAITLSTPPAASDLGLGCGTAGGAPGSMLFERSPGTHTYELRYADCGCDPGDAPFSNRTLRVAPRL